ncbi:GNAT family N-acetyltransferase [Paenibacillus tuaregi]|uniref:GNAT family N-acetyltransferase n=1 Tax=Paenibacillus tuaregi TaxID=1816681 RepID=UPI00083968A5|nr:GNAT family N-acetyltransferase [Paenibacillus tuaregi]
MEIRKALPEDEPFLYEVFVSGRWDEVKTWGWGEEEIQSFLFMQWTMQINSYQLQYPQAINHIISYDQKPAGRMLVQSDTKSIRLIDICLLPPFRNKGIGSALLHELQRQAGSQEIPLFLSVTPTNPARRLYERHGFLPCSQTETYWEMVWSNQTIS